MGIFWGLAFFWQLLRRRDKKFTKVRISIQIFFSRWGICFSLWNTVHGCYLYLKKYFQRITIFSKFFEQGADKIGNKQECNLSCVYSLSYVSLQTHMPSSLAPRNSPESYPATVKPERVLCQVLVCVFSFEFQLISVLLKFFIMGLRFWVSVHSCGWHFPSPRSHLSHIKITEKNEACSDEWKQPSTSWWLKIEKGLCFQSKGRVL